MRFPIFQDFLSLVFPKTCCLCKRSLYEFENQLCRFCLADLPVANYHLTPQHNDLKIKVMGLTEVQLVFAFLRFTKKGNSQKLLHLLKYKNKPELGLVLGNAYGEILKSQGYQNHWDVITPVPLHPLKQKRRGYNQSEQFAIGLGESLDIASENLLKRIHFTETQTNKSRIQRLQNVEDVFNVEKDAGIQTKKILLIDDVMTTGATLSTCANILLKNNAKSVDLLVLAAGQN